MEYNSFSMRQVDGNELWTMREYLSPAQITGLIVGGNFCLHVIPIYNDEYFEVGIRAKANDLGNLTESLRYLADWMDNSIEILAENAPQSEITREDTVNMIRTNNYALWTYNGRFQGDTRLLDLYGFKRQQVLLEFIQGIVTICQAFNVASTDVIAACPITRRGEYYTIGFNDIILKLILLPEQPRYLPMFPIEGQNNVFPMIPALMNNDEIIEDNDTDNDNGDDYNFDDYDPYPDTPSPHGRRHFR